MDESALEELCKWHDEQVPSPDVLEFGVT